MAQEERGPSSWHVICRPFATSVTCRAFGTKTILSNFHCRQYRSASFMVWDIISCEGAVFTNGLDSSMYFKSYEEFLKHLPLP